MKYTEEEKEAIEVAKEIVDKKYGSIMVFEIRDMEKILNLLDKQQKEIERLYKDNFRLDRENQLKFERAVDTSDYVPKEAIREKIKEIEENGYWDFLEERDCEKTINILKELLGDE